MRTATSEQRTAGLVSRRDKIRHTLPVDRRDAWQPTTSVEQGCFLVAWREAVATLSVRTKRLAPSVTKCTATASVFTSPSWTIAAGTTAAVPGPAGRSQATVPAVTNSAPLVRA